MCIRDRKEADENAYFCLGLKGGGCSGFMINVSFKSEIEDTDKVFEFDDIKVAVNKKSYLYLNGTTIDYKENLMGACLDFKIPEATRKCGCGESISF